MDCLLVSRNGESLLTLKMDLEREAPVMVTILQADLAEEEGRQDLLHLVEYCELKPDLLILSAGILARDAELAQKEKLLKDLLNLHVYAQCELLQKLLPVMQAEGNGYILLLSSLSALLPLPGFAYYSATKAFQLALGLALAPTLRKQGISLSVCAPGLVRTQLFSRAGCPEPPHSIEAQLLARQALKAVFARRPLILLPWKSGWRNRLFWILPACIQRRILQNLEERICRWQEFPGA